MIEKTREISDVLNLTKSLPTIRYVKPKHVYIATTSQRCQTSEVYVKVGDKVKIGTVLGKRFGGFFEQNMHATVSGTVTGFVKKFHRSGKLLEFIEIENDFTDERDERIYERSEEEIATYTREDFINAIKENSCIGLSGSSFPTYIKFQTDKPIDVITVNGVECEPYLTTDHRIMLEMPELVFGGIKYCLQAFNAKKAVICIKKKYNDVYEVLTAIKQKYPELPVEIKRVGNYYPQGWEVEMIKSALGVKIQPKKELPMDHGIVNFNVSTIVSIYRAVKFNTPVIERNFTVTGDGVNYPSNLRIRIGTPLPELIELCGGYKGEEDKVLILGGPMMGANLVRDDAVCTNSCTSAIILNKKDVKEEPCIRCASCVYSCPCGLQPVLIMKAVKIKDVDALKKLRVNECIECGMCGYTCTSKINLTDYMRQGKKLVK